MAQAEAICASSILACGLRVTLLDSDGSVADDDNNYYVTKNMIQIQATPDIEAGSDRTLKSGCDCIVATAKFPDLLKRFNFQIDLGQLEPALVSLMTGAPVVLDTSDTPVPIGWDWPVQISCADTPPPKVAIEVWSDVWDNDHQSPFLPYWHWIWPQTQWQFGQVQLNTDFYTPVLNGFSEGNSLWGHGPYGDGKPDGTVIGHLGSVWQTDDTPPDGFCGYQTITPSS